MRTSFWRFLVCSFVACGALAAPVEKIAKGVYLLRGEFVPGRQPDGNTVIFETREGLVVVDTGRHRAHTKAILDFAGPRKIKAVVNTHWHLDHVGGNVLLRREVPGVTIYASGAIAEARKTFLANYASQLEQMIARTTAEEQERFRTELALIQAGDALAPDEVIAASGTRTIAGRQLRVHLETSAATTGDLWLVDEKTGTLVAGDLVTLPFPFFDTADREGWNSALARIAATKFTRLVPGHGPVLSRAELEQYRRAYANLVKCRKSKEECKSGWLADAGALVPASQHEFVRQALDYYLR